MLGLVQALVDQEVYNDEYFNGIPLTVPTWGNNQCPLGFQVSSLRRLAHHTDNPKPLP